MKKSVSRFVTLLILCSLLVSLPQIGVVKAESTIYIRADGSVEGTDKIQRIGNVYTFTDNIYDSIVVKRDNIVVDGAGYTRQGTEVPDSKGIYLSGIDNVTIKNMIIEAFRYGILIEDSSNNRITGNKIRNSILSSIELESSNDNYISENQIDSDERSVLSRGILLTSSSKNRIHGNTIADNFDGILLQWSSENNIISGNKLTNNEVGISLDSSSENNIISGNNITNNGIGIHLRYHSGKNTLSGNDISNNNIGISFEWSSNNLLRNNRMTNNKYNFDVEYSLLSYLINDVDESNTVDGKPIYYWVNQQNKTIPSDAGYVALVDCTDITVQNLNLVNNKQGILLAHTTNSKVTKNNITNSEYGIFLHYSSYNAIKENKIKANDCGIKLGENSHNNSISGNQIEASVSAGISLFVASNNSIIGNNMTNNNVGIGFLWSHNNIIHHNNLVKNTKQVNDGYYALLLGSTSVNIWDNGYEGNYWDNYLGVDNDGDGIGDTPHNIYEDNQDNYPLMKPVNISGVEVPSIPEAPDTTPHKSEPFPTWVVVAIVIIAIVGVALLVYFRKIRKTTGEAEK